jgi:ribosomal protein S18 acetylase RimI-like enzyme
LTPTTGRHLKQSPGRAQAQQLNTGAMADDGPRLALLRQNGFVPEGDGLVHMVQPLGHVPAPTPPPGYALRSVAGPHEAPARAALHRLAFHPSRVDDDSYRRLMGLPGYDAALDVVAVGPGGAFAAFAMCWVDAANRVGEFEPVGTAPASRRLGLARAALLEGLRRMQAGGAETAIVAARAASLPATELYQSVGFRIVNREFELVRPD